MTDNEINEAVTRKLGHGKNGTDCHGYVGIRDMKTGIERRIWPPADYCHSIQAAWEIMEYLAPKYFGISIGHGTNPDFWQAEIHSAGFVKVYERADTAPMAICRAFLKLP